MVAISCLRSQSSVDIPLPCNFDSVLCLVWGLRLSTPSRPLFSRSQAQRNQFWFIGSLDCRWLGGVVRLSFLLVVTVRLRIVGSIGSIPTIFRFVGFATSVTYECGACAFVWAVVSTGLEPLISSHLLTIGFEMAELVAIKAISVFGVLKIVFCWFRFSF